MPQVRRNNLPPALLQHLLDRIQLQQFTADQPGALPDCLDTGPAVPEGEWYHRFAGMTVCLGLHVWLGLV